MIAKFGDCRAQLSSVWNPHHGKETKEKQGRENGSCRPSNKDASAIGKHSLSLHSYPHQFNVMRVKPVTQFYMGDNSPPPPPTRAKHCKEKQKGILMEPKETLQETLKNLTASLRNSNGTIVHPLCVLYASLMHPLWLPHGTLMAPLWPPYGTLMGPLCFPPIIADSILVP